jgi:hypothetical protein
MLRRDFLRIAAGSAALSALPGAAQPAKSKLSAGDEAFLDDMQRRGCLYFVEQASRRNGQVLDRASAASDGKLDPRPMTSIAATGFGLSALCVADKRRYFPHDSIVEQVVRTLRFHADELYNNHGFFYHFNHIETGARTAKNEVSSVDTALLLCGVLTARAHFHNDEQIQQLATKIYERVDWPWMLNQGKTFAMGWNPENGFITARWNHYCELMMIYLLAMGSPTHPIDADCWDAWSRDKMTYAGFEYIGGNDPIFVHQYSHAWFDFRGKRDKYANYFENSVTATRAHKAFCLKLGKPYSDDYWGISASDSAHGYTAWGGPSTAGESFGGVDGSVVPNATAGSLPFLPAECLRVLRALKTQYGQRAWKRYGLCDAFHPEANWYDPDVLGIDLGIGVLMAENLRSGFVWDTFGRNAEVGIAMKRAEFTRTA